MNLFSAITKRCMIVCLCAFSAFAFCEVGVTSTQVLSRSKQLIKAAGYSGSFVLQRANGKPEVIQGDVHQKLIPASTFKVLLALIALEVGALKSADELIPWNQIPYPNRPEWQKALTLREAMQNSSESYFGVLAKRIGQPQLKLWLAKLHYGNQQLGALPEKAWLEGVLLVSPLDQLTLMESLRTKSLPIHPAHFEAVKLAMLDHEQKPAKLYFKTGTMSGPNGPGLGWLVGWIDGATPEQGASFVLQIDLLKMDDRQKRIRLVKQLLYVNGLL